MAFRKSRSVVPWIIGAAGGYFVPMKKPKTRPGSSLSRTGLRDLPRARLESVGGAIAYGEGAPKEPPKPGIVVAGGVELS